MQPLLPGLVHQLLQLRLVALPHLPVGVGAQKLEFLLPVVVVRRRLVVTLPRSKPERLEERVIAPVVLVVVWTALRLIQSASDLERQRFGHLCVHWFLRVVLVVALLVLVSPFLVPLVRGQRMVSTLVDWLRARRESEQEPLPLVSEELQMHRVRHRLLAFLARLLSSLAVSPRSLLAVEKRPEQLLPLHLVVSVIARLTIAPVQSRTPCLLAVEPGQQAQKALLASVAGHTLQLGPHRLARGVLHPVRVGVVEARHREGRSLLSVHVVAAPVAVALSVLVIGRELEHRPREVALCQLLLRVRLQSFPQILRP